MNWTEYFYFVSSCMDFLDHLQTSAVLFVARYYQIILHLILDVNMFNLEFTMSLCFIDSDPFHIFSLGDCSYQCHVSEVSFCRFLVMWVN